jgi:hypothetical protein
MAAIHLYCDEAGKFRKSDYTSFGGYIQSSDKWEKFSREWNDIRRHYEVPPIHMGAMSHPEDNPGWPAVKEKWGERWEANCEEMLKRLATKVQEHMLVSLCAVVDAKHFLLMPPSKFKTRVEDPKYLAFQDVVLRSIGTVNWGDSDVAIGLVLDDDQETAVTCYDLLIKLKRLKPEIKKRISGICFVEDSWYPGVQAADMVTYEARRYMVAKLKDASAEPSKLLVALTGFNDRRPWLYTARILDEMASIKETDDGEK